jgi:hypothetical protein
MDTHQDQELEKDTLHLERLVEIATYDLDAEAYYHAINQSVSAEDMDRVQATFGYMDAWLVVLFISKAR